MKLENLVLLFSLLEELAHKTGHSACLNFGSKKRFQ